MSFDFESMAASALAVAAEKTTDGILRGGWRGAAEVEYVGAQHRSFDHACYLPERQGFVRIDTKAVRRRYANFYWESRHEDGNGSRPGWAESGEVDLIFYHMPDPHTIYVIDLLAARPIAIRYPERKNDRPSTHNGRCWWTYGRLVPLNALGNALLDTITIMEPADA